MAMKRWEPANDIESMRRQMESLMGRFLGRGLEGGQGFLPNVEVFATDDEVVVNAELPGMKPEEVTVEVNEDAIHLYGENKSEQEVKQDNYYRSERVFGRFDRVIALPEPIKEDEAKATFKNGLLTIRAPLVHHRQTETARKVQIQVE
ncbi:MAG TPA: Hsp20/alpha crystallin family protein [Oscillatoriaceae cyanobacterium]